MRPLHFAPEMGDTFCYGQLLRKYKFERDTSVATRIRSRTYVNADVRVEHRRACIAIRGGEGERERRGERLPLLLTVRFYLET